MFDAYGNCFMHNVYSVADDLLEEILGQVTEELEAVCDGFVEHLYGAEFTPES